MATAQEAKSASGAGAGIPSAEDLFEAMLLQMGARRRADDILYARVGASKVGKEVATPFGHRDLHGFYELALVTEGVARVTTPTDNFELRPGRLLLIEPGIEHFESPGDVPMPYVGFWCVITETVAGIYRTSYSPPGTWRRGPSLQLAGRTGIEGMVRAMAAELETQEWNWLASVNALLVYLTSILVRRVRRGNVLRLRATESPAISADPHTWKVIREALSYCELNFRRPTRLTHVAAAVGYSPTHLSRLISTHLGHSLSDHIRSLRITAGKHLLETSDLAISEIAHSLGYSDPAHFSHAFSRATGLSPRAYRRRMGVP